MKANWLEEDGAVGGSMDTESLQREGIVYEFVDPKDAAAKQRALDRLKMERGYPEQDEVALTPSTPDLQNICAKFVKEHFHDEDEVRFVLDGAGVFDIRSRGDRWMRVRVESGDLIVVPARRHHRFMLTDTNQIRCVRLFRDASGWVPHYRHRNEGQ